MAKVLDSSAVLAFLYDEPGAEKVRPDLLDGIISAVNAAEVLAVLVRKGAPLEEAVVALQKTRLQVQEFSAAGAVETASLLSPQFRSRGLSLAEVYCRLQRS
jgi:PIN domain nuclease of toxin-antitoxin system